MRWVDGSTERVDVVPRRPVAYFCVNGHRTEPSFAVEIQPPPTWECPRCGLPAGQDELNPPARPRTEPYKSHLAYVKERRSEADGAAILAEAMERLRARRPVD